MSGSARSSVQAEQTGFAACPGCDPSILVIAGAKGDLARRELIPSLFELFQKDLLPEPFAIVGFARGEPGDEAFRELMREEACSQCPGEGWKAFAELLHFEPGEFEGSPEEDYRRLGERIEELRRARGIADNVAFHLAVPPRFFATIAERLGQSGLARGEGWRRLVVEKPFGHDRDSARELDRRLEAVFPEDEIYRVDHFLGKETVQNLLVFRFANPSFEPIWNREHVEHVQITVAESIGIGTRAGFYDGTGALRDMVQNHLLQLLCFAAIEPPVDFEPGGLRDETVKVLRSARVSPVDPERDVVRGQYAAGVVDGEAVPAYVDEQGVDDATRTETFVALRLTLDSWRWSGVPFYLRTGKRMATKRTEVAIRFRSTPHVMFASERGRPLRASSLVFRLQPDEGIEQTFLAKRPGPGTELVPVRMDFRYAEAFGLERPPRAYAWLLRDVLQGDQKLFARSDWIEQAWAVIDPIARRWAEHPGEKPLPYAAGGAGPAAADELLARHGHAWRSL